MNAIPAYFPELNETFEEAPVSTVNKIQTNDVGENIKDAVERALRRNIPGLAELPQTESEYDVGLTPKQLVFTEDTCRLYHYDALVDEIYRVPVVIVMSPVARGYILDLAKGQSLIEYLLLQGHDVFLVEWTGPRKEHADLGFEDYVTRLLGKSVAKVVEISGEPDVNMIGYCMGGMLATMYAATTDDHPLNSLACFTTPYNAEGMTLYKSWVEADAFDIDRLVSELGIIPGDFINNSIQALRPLQKTAGQLTLLNNVENDAFVKAHLRFDHWATNQLPVPGKLMKEMFVHFLRENRIRDNTFPVGEKTSDLSRINIPFLHVAAEYDHIVPSAASQGLVDAVSSEDKQEILVKGGHVSLVAGGNAIYRLWPQLDRWLSHRAV